MWKQPFVFLDEETHIAAQYVPALKVFSAMVSVRLFRFYLSFKSQTRQKLLEKKNLVNCADGSSLALQGFPALQVHCNTQKGVCYILFSISG